MDHLIRAFIGDQSHSMSQANSCQHQKGKRVNLLCPTRPDMQVYTVVRPWDPNCRQSIKSITSHGRYRIDIQMHKYRFIQYQGHNMKAYWFFWKQISGIDISIGIYKSIRTIRIYSRWKLADKLQIAETRQIQPMNLIVREFYSMIENIKHEL